MKVSLQIDRRFYRHVKRPWLHTIVEQTFALARAKSGVQVDLTITDDDTMHELNKTYRGINKPTDVLAFPLSEESDPKELFVTAPGELPHLGEVIVSYPTATRQAEEHGHSVNRELAILVIHGLLHLLGYDHDTDDNEKQMKALERDILYRIPLEYEPPAEA